MAGIAELQVAIDAVNAKLTAQTEVIQTESAQVVAEIDKLKVVIADLEAVILQLQEGQTVELQPFVDQLTAIASNLDQSNTNIQGIVEPTV